MNILSKLLTIIVFFQFLPLNASVLDDVKNRGYLICGVSEPRSGFVNIDDKIYKSLNLFLSLMKYSKGMIRFFRLM